MEKSRKRRSASVKCEYCGDEHQTEEDKNACGGLCDKKGCHALKDWCKACEREYIDVCAAHVDKGDARAVYCAKCDDSLKYCESCEKWWVPSGDDPATQISVRRDKDDDWQYWTLCYRCSRQ